ncbi:hypothetical protein [Novosphingobium sp.]|uniref:hypothetical protein n=1 Tax=Novosphingobium sp. TaxID=1874826 RepID=UPI00260D9CEC|nr:hypothetical protein [Novosphingobium sp.]
MKLSTRYGLAGLGGLALLTLVQWARQEHLQHGAVLTYLIGVGPNFAAAIAITFVLLGVWSEQRPGTDGVGERQRFRVSAAISGGGLLAWEAVQTASRNLVFDWQDVLATFAGIAVCHALFARIRPRSGA